MPPVQILEHLLYILERLHNREHLKAFIEIFAKLDSLGERPADGIICAVNSSYPTPSCSANVPVWD